MDIGIRFSSPIPNDVDIQLLSQSFEENFETIKDVIDTVPYEVSILICTIRRLQEKLGNSAVKDGL